VIDYISEFQVCIEWWEGSISSELVAWLYLVGGDGLVVPSWLALCWIAQGPGSEPRKTTTGGDITGRILPSGWFPPCHKSIYRVSEDNFRGYTCVSECMLISVKKKMGGWSFMT
jgi:hypothetical protein